MELMLKGASYRTGVLDAFTQLHISRRLTPLLGKTTSVGDKLEVVKDEDGAIIDVKGDTDAALAPLTEAIAAMKDEDAEYIINACLDVAERKQPGGGWAPVRANRVVMYSDVSLAVMLQLAFHTLRENMRDFFTELPLLSSLQGFLKLKV